MTFRILFTPDAREQFDWLKCSPDQRIRFKAVQRAFLHLQEDPKHPSLQTHKYHGMSGPEGQEVFEAYAQQHAPGAYRIFFYYGPHRLEITVFAIVPHP